MNVLLNLKWLNMVISSAVAAVTLSHKDELKTEQQQASSGKLYVPNTLVFSMLR